MICMRQTQKFFYFLIVFFLVACARMSTPAPHPASDLLNFLQSSCSAPCWNGITPGKTTKSEFLQIISSLPLLQDMGWEWADENGPLTEFLPDTPNMGGVTGNGKSTLIVDVKDSIVADISFSPESIQSGPTLEDMVKLYGNPAKILGVSLLDSCDCTYLYLIYPEKGLILTAFSDDVGPIRVLPQLFISEVVFFDPAEWKSSPGSIVLGGVHCEIQGEVPSWQGYTKMDFSKISSYCFN